MALNCNGSQSTPAPFSRYAIELKDLASDRVVWRATDVAAIESVDGRVLPVTVPASFKTATPPRVAQPCGRFRGAHDVREHHGGQHAVGLGPVTDARQELLDLAQDGLAVAHPGKMIVAGQLDVLRTANTLGEVSAARDTVHEIPLAMNDERRDANGREDAPRVGVGDHADQCADP